MSEYLSTDIVIKDKIVLKNEKSALTVSVEKYFDKEDLELFNNLKTLKNSEYLCYILFKKGLEYQKVIELMNSSKYFKKLKKRQQTKVMHQAIRLWETESSDELLQKLKLDVQYHISTKAGKRDNQFTHSYYTNNIEEKRIEKKHTSETKYEDDNKEEKSFFQTFSIDPIINAAIKQIIVYRNDLTETDIFEISFITYSNRFVNYKGTLNDIVTKLEVNALIADRAKAKDALSCLIVIFEKLKQIKVEKTLDIEGFFFSDNQLLAPKEYQIDLDLNSLKMALQTFNEAIEAFYSELKAKAVKIAKWMLVAPFFFAKKQLFEDNHPVKLLPYMMIRGPGGSGKTKANQLFSRFYIHYRNPISSDSMSTVPRLARKVSETTFPLIANEPISIFSGRGSNQEVRESLKNHYENPIVRSKYNKGTIFISELGASPIVFTTNYAIKLRDGAEERRFDRLNFTSKDKSSIEPNQDNFDTFMALRAHQLQTIGVATYTILKENPMLLQQDYETMAEELFTEFYELVQLEVPSWITMRIKELEHQDSIKDDIIQAMQEYAIDQLAENRVGMTDKEGDIRLTNFHDRIHYLTRNKLKTSIYVLSKYETDGKILESNYFIMKEFLSYLSNKEIGVSSLEDLADTLDGKYSKFMHRGVFGSRYAVKIAMKKIAA